MLGIDASQGMFDVAAVKDQDTLRFRRLDIGGPDFVEVFDIVFSNATLR